MRYFTVFSILFLIAILSILYTAYKNWNLYTRSKKIILGIAILLLLLFIIPFYYISPIPLLFSLSTNNVRSQSRFQPKHYSKFYDLLFEKDNYFYLNNISFIEEDNSTIKFKDSNDRIYYIIKQRKYNEDLINNIIIPALEEFNVSIIYPTSYIINEKVGHAFLYVIENNNGILEGHILNSHPGYIPSKQIEYIKSMNNENNLKLRYYVYGCGIQFLNSQCVKYVAKMLYNYIKIGKPLSEIKDIICPGYSWLKTFKYKWDPVTSATNTYKEYNGEKIYHLSSKDIKQFANISIDEYGKAEENSTLGSIFNQILGFNLIEY